MSVKEKKTQEIKPLTNEEITSLDVAAMLRKMGELDQALHGINLELAQAEREYGEARIRLEILKAQKSIIVERCRNIKGIVRNA